MAREYPSQPILAVGVVLLDGDSVLLIERGRPPNQGRWTVPGGGVEVGESMRDAALRELREETGLSCTLGAMVEMVERIIHDDAGRPRYHYVIVDFLGTQPVGEPRAASDASALRFVPIGEIAALPLTDDLAPVIERARAIRDGASLPPYQPDSVLRR